MKQQSHAFTADEASDLYDISRWGNDYFSIGDCGNVLVHPDRDPNRSVDLKNLVDRLQVRGMNLPLLIRFGDILRHRLKDIDDSFGQAIAEHNYQGRYCCVYPIKVNQQRQVVEEVVRFGRKHGFGLEAGSKPELLAVLAVADNDTPIICNGFKDAQFIEMAMFALKIGRRVIPVVEKYTELRLILDAAERLDVRPTIGVRVKLAARGAGRWKASGGHGSKFGLSTSEVLAVLKELKSRDMADCLQLLHFHLGSQITDIRQVKAALIEGARVYVDLARQGAGLTTLDVGGGLGVDYSGWQNNVESSANYTLQEYANDVVYHIRNVCDEADVAHPTIISESGRALVAYHSVLIFNVLGVAGQGDDPVSDQLTDDAEQPLVDLKVTYDSLSHDNLLESYHDAQQALDMAMQLFCGGYLPLEQRAAAETLYWSICRRVYEMVQSLDFVPNELRGLKSQLAKTYFCNFSLFQSLPDCWAIDQQFPVMPIHRLDEQPMHHAILGDITCDSDGRLDQFIGRDGPRRALPLHPHNGQPYYLGAFLVGAYQEILGDLHNLFGDTDAVHISLDERGEAVIDTVIKGDTVREVLNYVQFDSNELLVKMSKAVEAAVQCGRIDDVNAGRLLRFYEEGLSGYTYLE